MVITLFLVMFPLGLISGLLGSALIATVISILTSLMSFAMLMLVVIGAIKAQQGWLLRYPGNLRLIKLGLGLFHLPHALVSRILVAVSHERTAHAGIHRNAPPDER